MASISLIIPCFNAAPFLAAALRSALDQTHPPDEIIVVDDGSTDASADLAEQSPGPITVLRRPHQGISAARNAGIEAARGDLVAFLDADDLWPPNSLDTRLALWRSLPGPAYVFGAIACFDDRTGHEIGAPEPGRLAGALLLQKQAFHDIGPFDTALRTGETLDWISRADAAGYACAATADTVLLRRVHTTNITRDAGALHADYLKVLRRSLGRRREGKVGC